MNLESDTSWLDCKFSSSYSFDRRHMNRWYWWKTKSKWWKDKSDIFFIITSKGNYFITWSNAMLISRFSIYTYIQTNAHVLLQWKQWTKYVYIYIDFLFFFFDYIYSLNENMSIYGFNTCIIVSLLLCMFE